ncbi:unnamed protein product, partial [marine sediment metagenome]
MGRRFKAFFLFMIILGFGFQAFAQFTPEELAERAKWERFLKRAEIVRHEKIGEGITKPRRLYLKIGDIEASGAWKNPTGVQQGFKEDWEYEIAAYKLDKFLELGMVPPTVERKFKGRRGSLQLWVSLATS